MSDCRLNGPKYDYGAKATTNSERNQGLICEDPFVRYFGTGSILGCLD